MRQESKIHHQHNITVRFHNTILILSINIVGEWTCIDFINLFPERLSFKSGQLTLCRQHIITDICKLTAHHVLVLWVKFLRSVEVRASGGFSFSLVAFLLPLYWSVIYWLNYFFTNPFNRSWCSVKTSMNLSSRMTDTRVREVTLIIISASTLKRNTSITQCHTVNPRCRNTQKYYHTGWLYLCLQNSVRPSLNTTTSRVVCENNPGLL